MTKNIETFKFKFLTLIRYFGDAFFYPFFAMYLKSIGLVESKIGFILSITPIISIIANPVYSLFCKDAKRTKNILQVITVLEAIVIVFIGFSSNFYIVSTLTLLLAIFGSCHYGLMDSFTAIYANISKTEYSSIRIFGSIAYIIATTFGGYIISLIGYRYSFIIAAVLFVISGLLYHLIKPFNSDISKSSDNKTRYKDICSNKFVIVFLVFYTLLNSTTYSIDSFLSTFYESLNVDSKGYGFIYSFFVLFEVITIIILNKLKSRPSEGTLFIVVSILNCLRMLVFFINPSLTIVVIFTGLKGIVNGIVYSILFPYLIKLVGTSLATTCTLIFNTVHSIYIAIANNIFGNVIDSYGYKYLYLIGLIISIITVVMSLVNNCIQKKNIIENQKKYV